MWVVALTYYRCEQLQMEMFQAETEAECVQEVVRYLNDEDLIKWDDVVDMGHFHESFIPGEVFEGAYSKAISALRSFSEMDAFVNKVQIDIKTIVKEFK